MYIDYLDTPLGLFEIMATEHGICQAIFCGEKIQRINPNEITQQSKKQLTEYFAKQRTQFTLPIEAKGTAFQTSVWRCLRQIPFGEIKAYGDIAKMLNNPKASQAVGGANGRNPIAIIVPCHRVVGANGALTGYAGGIERKLWLLKHENPVFESSHKDRHRDLQHIKNKRQEKTQFLR